MTGRDIRFVEPLYTVAEAARMIDVPPSTLATWTKGYLRDRAGRSPAIGEVWTSSGDYCLGGITRSNVLQLCAEAGIAAREKNFSLTEVYSAEEAFVTGTFAGLAPVRMIDGRTIGDGRPGPVVARLQQLYRGLVERDVVAARES